MPDIPLRRVALRSGPVQPSAATLFFHFLGLASIVVGYGIGTGNTSLLPASFFADAVRIEQYIADPGATAREGSYRGTAELYTWLGVSSWDPIMVGNLGYVLFIVVLLYCYPLQYVANHANFYEKTLFYLLPILAGVFLFTFTKEFFVLIITAGFAVGRKYFLGEFVALSLMLAYGILVRQYWFVVVGLYILCRLTTVFALRSSRLIASIATGMAVLAVVFNYYIGVPLNFYRTSVVEDLSVSPGSLITDPLTGRSLIEQLFNTFYVLFTLQFPLPLLGVSAQQIVGGVIIGLFWCYFWLRMQGSKQVSSVPTQVGRLASLLVAYVATLSLFEPDYGSYLRHLLPLLPLFLLLGKELDKATNERKGSRERHGSLPYSGHPT